MKRRVRLVPFLLMAVLLSSGKHARAEEQSADKGEQRIEERGGIPLVVYWDNDLILSTPNEKFRMKIRGNLHFDTKFYGGNSGNSSPQFDIRRARIDFQGAFFRYLTWRVQAEFADSPYIRNAWADFRFRDWLHLRGGQMKPPFSTSWWTMDNRVNFMERGAGTPIYPYFDRGWWIWGNVFNKAATWNLAGFTGAGMEADSPKGDVDDHKDLFGRVFVSPFRNTNIRFLHGLHLCAEGSLGDQSIPTKRFEQKGYGAAVRDDKFWTWETEDPGTGEVGSRDRWGFEIHYLLGPFTLSSEYLVAQYENIRVFATDGTQVLDENGQVRSWSTWVSYYLTGENKGVGNFGWKAPRPDLDFDPVRFEGTGAWEVLIRYTYTKTSNNLFESVSYAGDTYRILEGADEVNEFTVGVCWTWNPMLRWQFNYVYLDGDGILTGDKNNEDGTKRVDHEDMFGLRMIFKF